ncbi:hypothetical protein ACQ4WX_50035 [Streptomyces lasalocidi]
MAPSRADGRRPCRHGASREFFLDLGLQLCRSPGAGTAAMSWSYSELRRAGRVPSRGPGHDDRFGVSVLQDVLDEGFALAAVGSDDAHQRAGLQDVSQVLT